MKKSAVVVLLILGGLILRGDGCSKSLGFGDSNAPSVHDSVLHATEIVALAGLYNSKNEQVEVTIDGAVAGTIVGRGSVTKKVESGAHTIAGKSLVSSVTWPTTNVTVGEGSRLNFSFRCEKPNLTITPSFTCKNKGVLALDVKVSNEDGSEYSFLSMVPGEPATIEAYCGVNRIVAKNQDTKAVIYDAKTPFIGCGSTVSVIIDCN